MTGQIPRGANLAYIDNADFAKTEWFAYRSIELLENGNHFIDGLDTG